MIWNLLFSMDGKPHLYLHTLFVDFQKHEKVFTCKPVFITRHWEPYYKLYESSVNFSWVVKNQTIPEQLEQTNRNTFWDYPHLLRHYHTTSLSVNHDYFQVFTNVPSHPLESMTGPLWLLYIYRSESNTSMSHASWNLAQLYSCL